MSNKNSELSENRLRIEVTGGFLLLCALTGFFCGERALCATALAAAVHELGHVAVMLRQGCLPAALRLDASGACLRCTGDIPGYRAELLRSLAGPLAGLLLWAMLLLLQGGFARLCGRMSFLLSAVNLLPGEGLDGGRALRCLVLWRTEPVQAERFLRAAEWTAAVGCFLAGLWRNPQLCLYGFWLLLRSAGIGD